MAMVEYDCKFEELKTDPNAWVPGMRRHSTVMNCNSVAMLLSHIDCERLLLTLYVKFPDHHNFLGTILFDKTLT